MNSSLTAERRDELIEGIAEHLRAWNLDGFFILLLEMHAPLAFLGSQLLFAAQPFVGVVTGDRAARELALLVEEPGNVERLIARLEQRARGSA